MWAIPQQPPRYKIVKLLSLSSRVTDSRPGTRRAQAWQAVDWQILLAEPPYEATVIENMFAKCHRDFAVDPDHTTYLIVVPYLTSSSWYKTYAKYYEHVK
eukprot:328577-Prorocentrum_minimum.AAC.1